MLTKPPTIDTPYDDIDYRLLNHSMGVPSHNGAYLSQSTPKVTERDDLTLSSRSVRNTTNNRTIHIEGENDIRIRTSKDFSQILREKIESQEPKEVIM
jgi:hypothetical protein